MSQRRMLLERLPDSLTSLGDVAAFLNLFKYHCALPVTDTWTEMDLFLKSKIDAAERWIEFQTGTTYRARNWRLTVDSIVQPKSQLGAYYSDIGRYYVLPVGLFSPIVLPIRPVTSVAIGWTDNEGVTGTFTAGIDYVFTGGHGLSPEINFLTQSPTDWLQTGLVPWPYVITFSSIANDQTIEFHKEAILQLAAYYFRNPEGMGQDAPDMGQGFWGLLDGLTGSFL